MHKSSMLNARALIRPFRLSVQFDGRVWTVFALAAAALLAGAMYEAGLYGRQNAFETLSTKGRADATLKAALLRAVLERPRALPLFFAQDQQVQAALAGKDTGSVQTLDVKLQALVGSTSASVLYVTDRNGIGIAASNWQEPLSFVGVDYSFRDYFRTAMEMGTAEQFALGTISRRPGLYVSRRVEGPSGPLGVVVVKKEFDQLEDDWHDSAQPSYVTNAEGIVLISSIPSWHFMTTASLSSERIAEIKSSLQFGDAPLTPLPIEELEKRSDSTALVRAILPGTSAATYLRISTPVPTTPWHLEYLVPVDREIASAVWEVRLLSLAFLVPLLAAIALLLLRRQVIAMRISSQQAARLELESRVIERTADLSNARDRLEAEIADHRSTEARLQIVQQELVQVNRLAILGQVAAGVAHEINQPVATIRAYADNARTFLSRGQQGSAEENLSEIAALTERIGTITEELKAFGRKGRTPPAPVELGLAIEGAVILLRSRFAGQLETMHIQPVRAGLAVIANRIRLEQVLINLFQNALEAMEGTTNARLDVSVEEMGQNVLVHIEDNGPGIAPDILQSLFTPFNTSKEKGLGLGLVIAKDIVSDYGGSIEVESSIEGTTVTIQLRKALI
jgi:two-component system, NtrC family, C4-dicarboxylate transport sensor histidine kinase DctB